MSKLKLPIIIAFVIAAAGAGLFMSGMVGGGEDAGKAKKHVIEPVALAEPFTINLADTQAFAVLATNIALQLEPMDDAHWAAFTGAGGGGHGGGGDPPGPGKVAMYPKFRDAVIVVASTFTSARLNTPEGKDELRVALLDKFHEIEQIDSAEAKAGAGYGDPTHVGPPYHVKDVFFTKYVIQTGPRS